MKDMNFSFLYLKSKTLYYTLLLQRYFKVLRKVLKTFQNRITYYKVKSHFNILFEIVFD